jgi:hypothetical protein
MRVEFEIDGHWIDGESAPFVDRSEVDRRVATGRRKADRRTHDRRSIKKVDQEASFVHQKRQR